MSFFYNVFYLHYALVRTNYNGDFAKGKAFTSRLGYDILNHKNKKKKFVIVLQSIQQYLKIITDIVIDTNKKFLYGNKGKPTNVVVGWLCNDNGTKMTSV